MKHDPQHCSSDPRLAPFTVPNVHEVCLSSGGTSVSHLVQHKTSFWPGLRLPLIIHKVNRERTFAREVPGTPFRSIYRLPSKGRSRNFGAVRVTTLARQICKPSINTAFIIASEPQLWTHCWRRNMAVFSPWLGCRVHFHSQVLGSEFFLWQLPVAISMGHSGFVTSRTQSRIIEWALPKWIQPKWFS